MTPLKLVKYVSKTVHRNYGVQESTVAFSRYLVLPTITGLQLYSVTQTVIKFNSLACLTHSATSHAVSSHQIEIKGLKGRE